MNKLWKIMVIGAFAALLVLPRTAAADVRFGIKGGANIANVNGNFSDELSIGRARSASAPGFSSSSTSAGS